VVRFLEAARGEKDDKETALFTCQLASMHMMRREQAEAYELLHRSLPALQKHLGETHTEVVYALSDYGEACLYVKPPKLNVAKRAFKKALEGALLDKLSFSDDFVQRCANGSTLKPPPKTLTLALV